MTKERGMPFLQWVFLDSNSNPFLLLLLAAGLNERIVYCTFDPPHLLHDLLCGGNLEGDALVTT